MEKIRVCFDTSAVCRLFDPDIRLKPEIETLKKLFRWIDEREQWLAVVSPMFFVELADAPEEKQELMVEAMERFLIEDLPYNEQAETLTRTYISGGVLSEGHWHDLTHIAYATLCECQYLVSCDERHIAKERTRTRVEKINSTLRHPTPQIVTPVQLLEKLP